jgi:hypothetical protein
LGARRDSLAHDLTLNVRVLACEGAANGTVKFRAVWDISSTDTPTGVTAKGDYRATDLRWDGKSDTSLVAQLSQAVAGLAGDIAAALAKK